MSETITTQSLFNAAVVAAGPITADDDYAGRVIDAAAQLRDVARDIEKIAEAVIISGIIQKVDRHPSNSARDAVFYEAVSGNTAGEVENLQLSGFRNDAKTQRLAERLRGLVGHKVRLFKYNEPDPAGKVSQGFRTVIGVVDDGPASAQGGNARPPQAPPPAEAPVAAAPPAPRESQDEVAAKRAAKQDEVPTTVDAMKAKAAELGVNVTELKAMAVEAGITSNADAQDPEKLAAMFGILKRRAAEVAAAAAGQAAVNGGELPGDDDAPF